MRYLLLLNNLSATPAIHLSYDDITRKPAIRGLIRELKENGAEGILCVNESRVVPHTGNFRAYVTPYALVKRVTNNSVRIKKLVTSPTEHQRGLPGVLHHLT